MDSLQDCTRAYLEESGCRCRREKEGGSLYTFAAKGTNGVYSVLVFAREPFLICVAGLRQTIPDERRLEAAEYLHRINYGLLLGNFEMDYDEGEVRFRTSLMAEGPVSHEVLDRYIQMPAAMLDRYAPGLAAIVSDGEIAQEALRRVQNAV
ncbi:MAG: YbjN domain-containing protein [Candidatus Spyradocola sp.]|jgi:hypothetical protein